MINVLLITIIAIITLRRKPRINIIKSSIIRNSHINNQNNTDKLILRKIVKSSCARETRKDARAFIVRFGFVDENPTKMSFRRLLRPKFFLEPDTTLILFLRFTKSKKKKRVRAKASLNNFFFFLIKNVVLEANI